MDGCGRQRQADGAEGNPFRDMMGFAEAVETVGFEILKRLHGAAPGPLDAQGENGPGVTESDLLSQWIASEASTVSPVGPASLTKRPG